MQEKNGKIRVVLTVVNIVLIVFCVISTVFMLIPIVFNHITKQDQSVFGNYLYINNNNNLAPVMEENDLVIVKPMSITQLSLGDFLCYYSAEDTEKNALFGKIVGFSDDELDLSDKEGHSTTVKVEDIIVVGKATNTIFALGSVISFFHSPGNRLLFYIIVGASALILSGITIILHVVMNTKRVLTEPVVSPIPVSYNLEELIQLEEEDIDFEKAPSKQETIHQ